MHSKTCFDVGIAEQHAVTLAAGMANTRYDCLLQHLLTFIKELYDQIIHDVATKSSSNIFLS
jgi:1-deoxy-D-xylulose-5-phosphate synthase